MQTVVHVTHEAIQKIGGIGAVLQGLLELGTNPYLAQLGACAAFVGVGFVLNYVFVFRKRGE